MSINIQQLVILCRSLPGATEDIKWGNDLVFSVGGKMFCAFRLERGEASGVSFKVEDERFLEFTDRAGVTPAPYLARAKWVAVDPGADISMQELEAAVRRSHALVVARLPKRLRDGLGKG